MTELYDIIFVGGGLSNGLAAYRLNQFRPDLKILVIESADKLGGNHTWSFHEGDLTRSQHGWIKDFVSATWSGYDVLFPQFSRTVLTAYFSIQSKQFHRVLKKQLGPAILLETKVNKIDFPNVILESGKQVQGKCVIDGRGWDNENQIPVGYQKFFGMDVSLTKPHNLTRPLLMDVTVPQEDGFRFFYLLPWSPTSVLVEDTRYSENGDLDETTYRDEITAYIQKKGWSVSLVNREEKGVLPIPLDGNLKIKEAPTILSGTRAGLFHSTTGYSLPQAVRFAEQLVELGRYDQQTVREWAESLAENHWKKEGFFRLLNRLLFKGANPMERFKVLQKFYRFPDDMISRFYAGQMRSLDQLRVFSGPPPISVTKAIRCLF